MNFSPALVALAARRCLSPAGLVLLGGALALALLLPFSPIELRGAALLSGEVSAGLARQGVWLSGLFFALPWFLTRSATFVRRWRQGEGAWLGTSSLSRWNIAWSHALGAGLALALALLPFAIVGEWRAGIDTPVLSWVGDAAVPRVALVSDTDRVSLSVEAPAAASIAIARFVIAAPGSGGPGARVRCTIERAGAAPREIETQITGSTPMILDLGAGAGATALTFERVGPGAIAVLDGPRLQWFSERPARWSVMLALFLHAWLAGTAALAIALGVAAWTSPGSAFLSAFAVLALAWLADRAPLCWPGVGLRDAIELTGAGIGPGTPALSTWLGCGIVAAAAPLLAAAHRDLWRRES